MKRLIAPAILLTLAACSSAPEPPPFEGYTNAPELTGWVLHRMSDGSIHADPKFDGVPYHGSVALGEGEDFWDTRGQDAVAISLEK